MRSLHHRVRALVRSPGSPVVPGGEFHNAAVCPTPSLLVPEHSEARPVLCWALCLEFPLRPSALQTPISSLGFSLMGATPGSPPWDPRPAGCLSSSHPSPLAFAFSVIFENIIYSLGSGLSPNHLWPQVPRPVLPPTGNSVNKYCLELNGPL